jgi:GTP-binding protein Era
MKSAVITVIGRPSAGKSSLVNMISGHKVSIVSGVPQTTRNKIRAIYSDERGQLVFLDTPGYYACEKKINLLLQHVMKESLEEVDLVLYLVDLSRSAGVEEQALIDIVKPHSAKLAVVFNKIDLESSHRSETVSLFENALGALPSCRVCALTGEGREELLKLLFGLSPEGEILYPREFYTDQEPAFRIAEIVRERVIANTREEIPHAVYVEIADMEMNAENTQLWVRGFICVERESQKGIVIGEKGSKIRAIMDEARAIVREIFPYAVALDFRVRVRPRWRRDDLLLKRLIY